MTTTTPGIDDFRTDLDDETFYAAVRGATEEELTAVMTGPRRDEVLDEVFRRMPGRLDPERARAVEAVIHWHVGDDAGHHDVFEVVISDGECRVRRGAELPPRVVLKIRPGAFLRLIGGATNGMKLMLTRRLQVEGDLKFAVKVEGLFRR